MTSDLKYRLKSTQADWGRRASLDFNRRLWIEGDHTEFTMISGKQIGQIVDALLSAFPTRADLAMLVTIELDAHLDAITTASNLRADIFALVQWAMARNRLNDLIAGARRQNPGNPQLQALPAQFEEGSVRQGDGESGRGGDSYTVGTAINSVVGPQGRVVNTYGGGDAAAWAEVRAALAGLNVKVDRLFGHIDQRSLQSVALIYRRIDALDRDLSAAIVDLVQQNALTADELDRHLAVIRASLEEVHDHRCDVLNHVHVPPNGPASTVDV